MTKARNIADLLDANGDVKSASLDNVPAVDLTNLSASNLTSGTIPDARVSASAVSQHAVSFDDNAIVNDLSTLALRQSSNENKSAYNSNSMFVDVFQDSTGITNLTNTTRNGDEFIDTATDTTPSTVKILIQGNDSALKEAINNVTPTLVGTAGQASSTKKFGTGSAGFPSAGAKVKYGTISAGNIATNQDFSIDCWVYHNASFSTEAPIFDIGGYYTGGINGAMMCRVDEHGDSKLAIQMTNGTNSVLGWGGSSNDIPDNQWFHLAITRISNTWRTFVNGNEMTLSRNGTDYGCAITMGSGYGLNLGWLEQQNQSFDGYIDNFRVSVGASLFGTGNFTPYSSEINYQSFNATGSFEGNTITTSSSTSKMGAILTYQNTYGTNALNTDIVLQLSADNGSNFTTATLTAMPDFSSGIKMAKVNDLSVTAGTQLKYRISFANQSSGSKEARIRGVSLQY